MKPITAKELKDTAEAITFIGSRADLLHSLCRAAQATAQEQNGSETDRNTINRLFELLLIMEDEIEYLRQEINTAGDIAAQEG